MYVSHKEARMSKSNMARGSREPSQVRLVERCLESTPHFCVTKCRWKTESDDIMFWAVTVGALLTAGQLVLGQGQGQGQGQAELGLSMVVVTSGNDSLVLDWSTQSSEVSGSCLVQVVYYRPSGQSRWSQQQVSSNTSQYARWLQVGRQEVGPGLTPDTWHVVCVNLTLWGHLGSVGQVSWYKCLVCRTAPGDTPAGEERLCGGRHLYFQRHVRYSSPTWMVTVSGAQDGQPWQLERSGAYGQGGEVRVASRRALSDGGSVTTLVNSEAAGGRVKLCTWGEVRLTDQVAGWRPLLNYTRCFWEGGASRGSAAGGGVQVVLLAVTWTILLTSRIGIITQ